MFDTLKNKYLAWLNLSFGACSFASARELPLIQPPARQEIAPQEDAQDTNLTAMSTLPSTPRLSHDAAATPVPSLLSSRASTPEITTTSTLPSSTPRLSHDAAATPAPSLLPSRAPTPEITVTDVFAITRDVSPTPTTPIFSVVTGMPQLTGMSAPIPSSPPIIRPPSIPPSLSSVSPSTLIVATPRSPTPPSLSLASSHGSPPSQHGSIGGWPPQHTPVWQLGPQHPPYVHSAAPYLIGVPGGPEWKKLLEHWVIFEGLSFSRAVSILNIWVHSIINITAFL